MFPLNIFFVKRFQQNFFSLNSPWIVNGISKIVQSADIFKFIRQEKYPSIALHNHGKNKNMENK